MRYREWKSLAAKVMLVPCAGSNRGEGSYDLLPCGGNRSGAFVRQLGVDWIIDRSLNRTSSLTGPQTGLALCGADRSGDRYLDMGRLR